MLNIEVIGDRQLQFYLEKIMARGPQALHDIIHRSADVVNEAVKKNLSNVVLNVRTGHLRRSITTRFGGTKASPYAQIGTNVIYAPVHEFGATIRAKSAPYLCFRIHTASRFMSRSGNRLKSPKAIYSWVRVKQVTIPPRPFMATAFKDSLQRIDRIVDEEIDKVIR